MVKGVDYTGITIGFFCHDGEGNYLIHKRSDNCRDEHGCWDFGGGGLKFNESLIEGLQREVKEEYGVEPEDIEFLGHDELHREHDGKKTHWIQFKYKAKVNRELVVNNEPHKHTEVTWVTIDSLPEPLHSQIPIQLKKYKDRL